MVLGLCHRHGRGDSGATATTDVFPAVGCGGGGRPPKLDTPIRADTGPRAMGMANGRLGRAPAGTGMGLGWGQGQGQGGEGARDRDGNGDGGGDGNGDGNSDGNGDGERDRDGD